MNQPNIALFEQKEIRKIWHEDRWFFAVVDVVAVLSESSNPAVYWRVMKKRLGDEGSNETVSNCNGFKMFSKDGKMRLTDCADTENLLRIIQSIPSPKAEPFKQWLAKVGNERIQEMSNPEIALNRSRELWKKHGRSEKWIEKRMTGQETRNKLTDYWSEHEVKEGQEYAILTNIIHAEWAEFGVAEHKSMKGLTKSQNLRDHMSEEELLFTQLAELSTRGIAENMQADGFEENKIPAKKGGMVARNAKKEYEIETGRKVITGANFLPPKKQKQLKK